MKYRRLLIGIAIGALILAACGGDSSNTTQPGEPATTTGETTTTLAETSGGIHSEDSDFGQILVNTDGFTLYGFTVDANGESACYDQCAELWPPVPADAEIGSDLDTSLFGSISRTDGPDQLTANGQPLYLYTPDVSPGDVNGQGFNNVWFVVDPNGAMVGVPEANAAGTSAGDDDGYGYDD